MANATYGTSSKENQALQKTINELRRQSLVPENGTFDEATRAELKQLQRDLGVSPTGEMDKATEAAIKEARSNKRTEITVNGKTAWVTKEEYEVIRAKAIAAAVDSLRGYVSKAQEARIYWDAHKQARDDNVICHLVDAWTGASFPDEGTIKAAEKAAEKMISDAKAGKSFDPASRAAPIEAALKAMSDYRKATFDGGEDMIKDLTVVRDACTVTLAILGAVATGGASWQVYVAVNAGVGAYNGIVNEIDRASTSGKFDLSLGNVTLAALKSAGIEATIALILKGGGKGMGNMLDDAVKKAAAEATKGGFKAAVEVYAKRAASGAIQELVKTVIRLLGDATDPNKKLKPEDIKDKLVIAITLGAGLKLLGPVLEKYGENTAKQYSAKDLEHYFKGLGKIDYKKAYADEGKKILEIIGKKVMEKKLKELQPDGVKGLEKEVHAEILKDPELAAWAKKAAANPKYKK